MGGGAAAFANEVTFKEEEEEEAKRDTSMLLPLWSSSEPKTFRELSPRGSGMRPFLPPPSLEREEERALRLLLIESSPSTPPSPALTLGPLLLLRPPGEKCAGDRGWGTVASDFLVAPSPIFSNRRAVSLCASMKRAFTRSPRRLSTSAAAAAAAEEEEAEEERAEEEERR